MVLESCFAVYNAEQCELDQRLGDNFGVDELADVDLEVAVFALDIDNLINETVNRLSDDVKVILEQFTNCLDVGMTAVQQHVNFVRRCISALDSHEGATDG